ncbi:MAG TPA: hypothetical protein VFM05_00720, partial [Candidatus Saccharimonadales bacterium]|nr:hypothetical protein [Candidatus Saccharimonadales bacterium]
MPRLRLSQKVRQRFRLLQDWRVRTAMVLAIFLVLAGTAIPIIRPYLAEHTYAMGNAETLLPEKDPLLSSKLSQNYKEKSFDFNKGYFPGLDTGKGGGPKISAVSYEDPKKGLTVVDPINNIEFTIKPKFKLLKGKKDGNRVVYPLLNGTGWLVYTMLAGSVKEDVVLKHANGDRMTLEYDLELGDNLEARPERDGAIGIYGSSLPIAGQVTTGSDKDADLLKRARQKAKKNKLVFTIPAPVAYEPNGVKAGIAVHYELEGKVLKTVAMGLKKARYPLTIDPTVTVNSTTDLFRDTNPDSNVDFDATTGGISRGRVTGGVIPAWTANSNNLAAARWLQAAVLYDDYIYVAGGANDGSTSSLSTIEFARLSSSDASIGTWSTTTAMPASLSRFQLIAYNGYLYAIGGSAGTTDCTTTASTVYFNRMQTNGQLSQNWSTTTALPSTLCGLGAAAYNG